MGKLVKSNLNTHNAKQFVESLTESANSIYYVYLGRHTSFDDDNSPPTANNSEESSFYDQYRNMIYGKHVTNNDVSHMIDRKNWTSGRVYTQYDHTNGSLRESDFYAIVQEANSNYSVFKCLFNNNGAPSTDQPTKTETSANDDLYITTADKYQWKYMYELTQSEFNKFATSEKAPLKIDTNVTGNAVSGAIDVAKGFTVNTGATFDAYALDENNRRINVFNSKNGGGLLRMTSANISTQYQLNNNTFKRGQTQEQIDENTSGGGRNDDLFGVSQNFSDSRQNMEGEEKEEVDLTNYIYKMPWSLNLAYSLTYNNSRGQKDFSTNSLMISSNLSLTPKWKVGISSGYDFKQKGFTYTQLRFDRDLDSWKLDFSWVPFSPRASWNFFIGIKSGLLSDLKYEKRSEPDRSL